MQKSRFGLIQLVPLAAVSLLCMVLAESPVLAGWGISPLTLAIVAGMLLGNTVFLRTPVLLPQAIALSKTHLLRVGIMLYGFRLTLAQIAYVGWPALLVDAAIVAGTMMLALKLGRRFGLENKTAALVGAGSAVCGAAAVLAVQPVLKAQERDVGVAVATVVVFGTLAMFVYPLLAVWLLPNDASAAAWFAWGIYTGSTVHEVAQVAAAGAAVNPTVADVAVMTKMIRVMLLAPLIMALPFVMSECSKQTSGGRLVMPWFVPAFLAMVVWNSWFPLPSEIHKAVLTLDTLLLTTAMFALGLTTRWQAVRAAGIKPLLLAGVLALWLLIGGGALSYMVYLLLK
ncbi:YeiH family putative sulfate export transporter [Neisseria sp. Dent CA1/247]|uniref:YeiH family protein n=1 Tax=Neisseria sp. Dent CA1/247 TaxID=2912675 RepID=UPI001FD4A07A|nr:YeiH family putative sulfate export transporter [Neisseria sp. Dent CA1/247]UOO75791.1 YeiH family putative sulfate export transporter [Neisseria sp. Dent CA1/247]